MAENQPLLGGGGRQSGPPPRAAPAPYPPAQQAGAPPPSQPGAGGYQTTAGGPAGAGPAPSAAHAGDPMPGGNTTAPALESMEKVSGYEGTGFSEDNFLPPPSHSDATALQPQSSPSIHANTQRISEEEVRASLLEFVSQHICYGEGAAQDMSIDQIQPMNAFHYRLESFTESRRTSWQHTPFEGQPIDSCMNGIAPQAWEINVPVGKFFEDRQIDMEVPHTAYIKPCHNCGARGYNRCHHCQALGYYVCQPCRGLGRTWHHGDGSGNGRCPHCNGVGRKSCSHCNGQGQVACPVCRTYTSLKWFINLTVKWKNNIDDHVVEATELPAHLIVNATGKSALSEQFPRLAPLTTFPDPNINAASNRLVTQHAGAFPLERMHQQRHSVRIIPISEAHFTFEGKSDKFWVYGENRMVYAPDYPQQCCCGCNIL